MCWFVSSIVLCLECTHVQCLFSLLIKLSMSVILCLCKCWIDVWEFRGNWQIILLFIRFFLVMAAFSICLRFWVCSFAALVIALQCRWRKFSGFDWSVFCVSVILNAYGWYCFLFLWFCSLILLRLCSCGCCRFWYRNCKCRVHGFPLFFYMYAADVSFYQFWGLVFCF